MDWELGIWVAQSTANGMNMGMREGSRLSTGVDRGAMYGDRMTGRQVQRVGGGHVNKFHFEHTKFEGLGDIEERHSCRQLHLGACQYHGEVPGPAERGQAVLPVQLMKCQLLAYQLCDLGNFSYLWNGASNRTHIMGLVVKIV